MIESVSRTFRKQLFAKPIQKGNRKKLLIFLGGLLFLLQTLVFVYEIKDLKQKIRLLRRKDQAILHQTFLESVNHRQYETHLRKIEELAQEISKSIEKGGITRALPPPLRFLPFMDERGVILSVSEIKIPSIAAPYNGAIVSVEDHYRLFFRYDTLVHGLPKAVYSSAIGTVELDQFLKPMPATLGVIDAKTSFPEDARALNIDGACLLVYNDRFDESSIERGIRVGAVDCKENNLSFSTVLENRKNKIEKNWTPFAYKNKDVCLVYSIQPHEILSLPDPRSPAVLQVSKTDDAVEYLDENWIQLWGIPRGGSPAQLVGGEYLSFFHSAFDDSMGRAWYVMGAYTFEAAPPFRITSISPHPILFEGIYSTPPIHTANPRIRCIYPAGIAIRHQDGRDQILLSCGENDSTVKIITFDQEALLKSLKRLCLNRD